MALQKRNFITLVGMAGKTISTFVFLFLISSCGSISPPPPPPSNVTAIPGNNKVLLSWKPAPKVFKANIYYKLNGNPDNDGNSQRSDSRYGGIVTNLSNGSPYYFSVTAVNDSGESIASEPVLGLPLGVVPGTPNNVSVIAGNGQISITWNVVPNADSYNIYYGVVAGITTTNATKITSATNSTQITGLPNGTQYFFRVSAVNSQAESPFSQEGSATPQVPTMVPSGLRYWVGLAQDGQVVLNWGAADDATSYNIYYDTSMGVTAASAKKVTGLTSLTTTIPGLSNNVTYYFIIAGKNDLGEGSPSSEIRLTPLRRAPDAPANINVISDNGQATMRWDKVNAATSYNVYYGSTAGVTTASTQKVTGIQTNATTITGLSNGSTYFFIVTAMNHDRESAVSSEVGVKVSDHLLGAPTNITITPGDELVTISWNPVPEAISYNIYYGPAPGVTPANGIKVTGISNESVVINGLSNNSTYSFIVTVVKKGIEKASTEFSAAVNNEVACSTLVGKPNQMVALILGQSNAANYGATGTNRKSVGNVYVYNNGKCYKAQDPLQGADGTRGSVWSRFGDMVVANDYYDSVVLVLQAYGGVGVREWHDGSLIVPLRSIIQQTRETGFKFTHILYHQGERDAVSQTPQDLYNTYLSYLVRESFRAAGGQANFYVAHATYCGEAISPDQVAARNAIRNAQTKVVNDWKGYALPGADTDTLTGPIYRDSGLCHFNDFGLLAHANLWIRAIFSPTSQ